MSSSVEVISYITLCEAKILTTIADKIIVFPHGISLCKQRLLLFLFVYLFVCLFSHNNKRI